MLKAKFKCASVVNHQHQQTANLSVVTADSEENKTFAKYTPSGEMSIVITNPDAIDFFKPGVEYVLTISAATQG